MLKSKHILIGILGLLTLFNIYRITQKDWNYADPIDFRGLYLGGQMLDAGDELYNDSLAANRWIATKTKEDFTSKTDFGNKWVSIMVYPPHAFTLTYPLHLLSWKTARLIWWFLGIIAFIAVLFTSYKLSGQALTIGLFIAAKGTFFAFALGQPLLLVLAFLILSVYWQKTHPVLAGICLGLAMMKFNLAIPFGLWFLLQKDFKLLASGIVTTLLILLPPLLSQSGIIPAYMQKVNDYYQMIYNPQTENIYTFSNSELTMALDYYFNQSVKVWKRINLLGQVMGYGTMILLFIRERIKTNHLLLGLCLVSFAFSYHLAYDAILLILPVMLLERGRYRNLGVAALIVLNLPWNALFTDYSLLKFNYPIIICLGLILYIFAHAQRNDSTRTFTD